MVESPPRRTLWIAIAVLWLVVVWVLLTVPGALLGDALGAVTLPRWLTAHADKVVHAWLFFVTALFLHRVRLRAGWGPALLAALVAAFAYGVLTEAWQLRVPGRSAEWGDLGADAFGASVYGVLAWLRATAWRS